jgi:hypothetical protein
MFLCLPTFFCGAEFHSYKILEIFHCICNDFLKKNTQIRKKIHKNV